LREKKKRRRKRGGTFSAVKKKGKEGGGGNASVRAELIYSLAVAAIRRGIGKERRKEKERIRVDHAVSCPFPVYQEKRRKRVRGLRKEEKPCGVAFYHLYFVRYCRQEKERESLIKRKKNTLTPSSSNSKCSRREKHTKKEIF